MNYYQHIPALTVVIPLLAAPLIVIIGSRAWAWMIAFAAGGLSSINAVLLLIQVRQQGLINYAFGGWAAPWGIEYRIDLLSAYVLLIVTAIAALVLLFARRSIEKEVNVQSIAHFYAVFLLVIAGMSGIVITGDAFNLFVFLEISSIASYALISMGKDRRALNAAFQYLVMGTIGATFILIGIGFLYMMTGTLNMQDLAVRLQEVQDTRTVRAGVAFLTVGIGLKLALFPLHLWLPNAYTYSPSVVSAFLAATATKVAVYVMLRFILEIFGVSFAFGDMPLAIILLALGVVGMLSASLVAVFQNKVKRMLAYSSVAQIGYIALGIGLASSGGTTAALLHLFNHALMKGALFLALGSVFYRMSSTFIHDLAGLGRRMPWTMAGIVIGGLSLIGVPPTVGFISKWYLVLATLEQGLWPLAALVLIASLMALIYVWRVIEIAYFASPETDISEIREAPLSMLLPVWILVAANIYFGINTELTFDLAQQAVDALFGVLHE